MNAAILRMLLRLMKREPVRAETEQEKWTRITFPASWEKIKNNSRLGL